MTRIKDAVQYLKASIEMQEDEIKMLLFNTLHKELQGLIQNADHTVELFAPYISRVALNEILKNKSNEVKVSIITTWKINDIAFGSSDLSIYPYCKENGVYLFLNQRIHLKSYLADYSKLLSGSANITNKALGLSPSSNYETLINVLHPSQEYLIYLSKIRSEATLITDEIAEKFQKLYEQHRKDTIERKNIVDEAQLSFDQSLDSKKLFLISALPMSRSLDDLFKVLCGNEEFPQDVLANARHDIANFDLESLSSSSLTEFKKNLTIRFFNHPFIILLCNFINEPKRFGAIKEWVQKTCTDVPIPSRRDLTGNVQVLYNWLIDLGSDQFERSRPNHTEIISPKRREN